MSPTVAGGGVVAAAVVGGGAIFLGLTVKWFSGILENIDGNILEIEFCGFEMMKRKVEVQTSCS
jgi:hypothetical protein